MLNKYCTALKMLSFGIWHKPICTTQVTEKTKMAATLTVSMRVFMHFRPLDRIFLYANVTPILLSSQNAFFRCITQASTFNTSDKKNKMAAHVGGVN